MRQGESARRTACDPILRDHAHILIYIRLWKFILVIGHAPSAAGAKMPFIRKSNFFCEIESQLDCRFQRTRIPKVRALMKMNTIKGKGLLFYKMLRFEEFLRVSCQTCCHDRSVCGRDVYPQYYRAGAQPYLRSGSLLPALFQQAVASTPRKSLVRWLSTTFRVLNRGLQICH